MTLESIRLALFGFLGIKEPDEPEDDKELERKIEKVTGKRTATNDEMQAWYKDGMPSPFDRWISSYRKSR